MTRGRIVEVAPDETTVLVQWRVGVGLAGRTTTERTEDLRRPR